MKIGASYNLFDGEELLKYSIQSIRDNVDYISVIVQTQSNFGNPCNPGLMDTVIDLADQGLIDHVVSYTPELGKHPHYNELRKRNLGLMYSKNQGCTHHLSIDADELYDADQFAEARRIMFEEGFDSSVCRLLTYYKNDHTVLDPMENYYVSFLFKIRSFNYNIIPFPVLVDPTRRMEPGNLRIFASPELVMHHFSYVRKDLKIKLENSSAKENWNETMMKKVIRHFSQWQPGMDALMAPATTYATKQITPKFKINV